MTTVPEGLAAALADRYRIERELGAGGMATVYLAEDLKHHRQVAVKVLRPELSALLGAERFLKEIELTANLQHPHLLPLFDSGEAAGHLYYVMPYVEGESLRAKLTREKQLSVAEAVRITTQVASALDYAHRHGVLHRDIKPENILLHEGQALIADFGIALALRQAGGNRLTETGLSLGTPQYMSPEQAGGDRALDGRSDIYSLGCVLYEMLTGEPPHTGPTVQSVIAKLLADEVRPVTELRRTVPLQIADALDVALAKLPADRFDSARAFADALTEHTGAKRAERLTETPGIQGRLRRYVWPGVAALLGVSLLAVTTRDPLPRPLTRFAIPAVNGLSMADLFYPNLAVAPDGRLIAYANRQGLVVHRLETGQADVVVRMAGVCCPFFSADGNTVGFVHDNRTKRVSVEGGLVTDLADFAIQDGTWDALGGIVFSRLFEGVLRIDAPGREPRPLTAVDRATEGGHAWPQLLDRGRLLLFTVLGPDLLWQNAALVIQELSSGKRTVLVKEATYGRYLPTGHLVYARADGTIEAVTFDLRARRASGPAQAVQTGVQTAYWGGGASFALSEAGTAAWVQGSTWGAHQLAWYDRAGRRLQSVGKPLTVEDLRLSPDGRTILTYVASRNADIYTIDALTGQEQRITFDDSTTEDHPLWSFDGSRILYRRIHGARDHRLYEQDARRRAKPSLLYVSERWLGPTSWSADGKWVAATEEWNFPTKVRVIGLSAEDSSSRIVATGRVGDAAFSPDARWLAYVSGETGQNEIYVLSFPDLGTRQQVSRTGGRTPTWAPGTGELFFWDADTLLVARPPVKPGDAWEVTRLFALPDSVFSGRVAFAVSRDGQRLLVREWSPAAFAAEINVALNWHDWIRATVEK